MASAETIAKALGRQRATSAPMNRLHRQAFATSRLLDFASRKELVAQTGHEAEQWPFVVMKELADNALDACEETGQPHARLRIEVDDGGITVADDGPGIAPEVVQRILDFSVRVSSREAYVSPTRGAQGNALKTIVAMPYVLGDTDGGVTIESQGCRHEIGFTVDRLRQEPCLAHVVATSNVNTGTSVRVRSPALACSLTHRGWAAFLQQAARYAWMDPHASVLVILNGEVVFDTEASAPVQKWLPSDPTSPHWYGREAFERLVAAYVVHEQETGQPRTVRELVGEFRGLTGSSKGRVVLEQAGLLGARLADLHDGERIDAEALQRLLTAMQEHARPVKPQQLGLIGEAHVRRLMEDDGADADSIVYQRRMGGDAARPWVLEIAFGWCPDAEEREIVAGVNWSPAIVDPFRDIGGMSLDGLLADRHAGAPQPVWLFIHLATPRAEYTDRGKSAISLTADQKDVVRELVEKVTAKWDRQMRAEIREADRRARRREVFAKRKRVTCKDAAFDVMEEAYLKASADGSLPAHARQVMYAARPAILEQAGKLNDNYFTQTLLPDFITENPELTAGWDVVFDARGHFQEPHTDRVVALGTLDVRRYIAGLQDPSFATLGVGGGDLRTSGPAGRFGAVLFVEKEGFMPLFQAVELAERFDIAIMSTKGLSNTASRSLVDDLGARGVPLLVLHDFDKAGFSIVGTLSRDTRRYTFANRIEVIDLGLRLADVKAEDLQAEAVSYSHDEGAIRNNLRRNGAAPEEIAFLQKQRVELNAFTSDALIRWLEEKLIDHGVRKVLPDDTLLAETYREAAVATAVQARMPAVIAAVRAEMGDIDLPDDLAAKVEAELRRSPERPWCEVVVEIAQSATETGDTP